MSNTLSAAASGEPRPICTQCRNDYSGCNCWVLASAATQLAVNRFNEALREAERRRWPWLKTDDWGARIDVREWKTNARLIVYDAWIREQ